MEKYKGILGKVFLLLLFLLGVSLAEEYCFEIKLTGDPIPEWRLQEAIKEFLGERYKGEKVRVIFEDSLPMFLGRGEEWEGKIKVNFIEKEEEISLLVKVINIPYLKQKCKFLYLSNRPELVEKEGILWESAFKANEVVRFLYYHKNGMKKKEKFKVYIQNNSSDNNAEVIVISGFAGPSLDGLFVGHKASMRFLSNLQRDLGTVYSLPWGCRKVLAEGYFNPGEIISGFMQFYLLKGEEVKILIKIGDTVEEKVVGEFNPFFIHPAGAFLTPEEEKDCLLTINKDLPWSFLIGAPPWWEDIGSKEPNYGNYGILYERNLILYNPSQYPYKLNFYFIPQRGVACGSFIIGDSFIETPFIKAGKRCFLREVTVEPAQKYKLRILTVPEAGSFYPVLILINNQLTAEH